MSDNLISFLISVSVLLAIALFIPCIECIARLMRGKPRQQPPAEIVQMRPAKTTRRRVA